MVGTVKNERRTTSDRTKFSDDQSVMINGILIQYVVLLKFAGIIAIVIVNRIVADNNIRSCNC